MPMGNYSGNREDDIWTEDQPDIIGSPGQPQAVADDDFSKTMKQWYKDVLGRTSDPTNEEINSHRQNPGGLPGAYQTIYNSDEAKAYRESQNAPKETTPAATPSPTAPATTGVNPGYSVSQAAPTAASVSSPSNDALQSLLASLMEQSKAQQAQAAARQADDDKYRSNIRGSILDTIGRASKNPSLNDPALAAQSQAFDTAGQGALKRGRQQMAARAAVEGMPTGAFDSAIQGSNTSFGKAKGAFDANLLGGEVKAQRDQLMQALQLGAGVLSDQERSDLQTKLATLDAQIKTIGMEQGGEQFGLDLALRKMLGEGQIGVAGAGVGAQTRGQDLQNQQFYDRLTYDMGKDQNSQDALLLQLLLGGA